MPVHEAPQLVGASTSTLPECVHMKRRDLSARQSPVSQGVVQLLPSVRDRCRWVGTKLISGAEVQFG
eukprot:15469868-Alexandrium_andersonii.AAC.1